MKKCLSLLLAAIFLLLIGWGCTRAPSTPIGAGADSIVISTHTATPNGPISPETSTPTSLPAVNSGIKGLLPGLSPVNVTVGLEGQNFTCTAVKKGAVNYQRTCLKGTKSTNLFQVVISGREAFLVDFISTSVLQNTVPDPQTALPLLGYIASTSYNGATPDEAKAWVESTVPTLKPGDSQEMVFGGVKYVLSSSANALTLEMGELP